MEALDVGSVDLSLESQDLEDKERKRSETENRSVPDQSANSAALQEDFKM